MSVNFPLIPADTAIKDIELSVRLYNGLCAYLHGTYDKTAGDLLLINSRDFSRQRSIGKHTIKEFERLIERIESPASIKPDPSIVSVLIAIRDENRAIEIELPRTALRDLGEFLSKIK